MDNGTTTQQKLWQYIRSLNSGDERLEAVAFADGNRTHTYRQLFEQCDRYARAFGGLGITQANGSRVGIVATMSVKDVFALFALNMLGVSVSLVMIDDLLVPKLILKSVKKEGITDLLLPDTITRPDVLQKIMDRRKEAGLKNVIVMRTSKQTPHPNKRAKRDFKQNLKELLGIKGVTYLSDALRTYKSVPIVYGTGEIDEAAAVVHTSGTTKGVHKPIPLSDVALNTAADRMLCDERFSAFRGNAVVCWSIAPAHSIGLVDELICPLAFGCTIRVAHGIMDMLPGDGGLPNTEKWNINVAFCVLSMFELLKLYAKEDDLDLSPLKMVIYGGTNTSFDQLKEAQKFVREHGGDPVFVNGYGLSECGAANLVSFYDGDMDEDKGIGQPLKGVSIRVLDEETGEFFSPKDGERTGVLYLGSASNSSGRIGDTVFFEPEVIDGEPYIRTEDLVRMDASGNVFFLGRSNRFFANSDDLRFDAGVVEAALLAQEGIEECAAVPVYEKFDLHDNVPVLYVRLGDSVKSRDGAAVLRRALRQAYVEEETVGNSVLPWMCVIASRLPHNASGKVDVVQIQMEMPSGKEYAVVGVHKDGKLANVRLVPEKRLKDHVGTLNSSGVSKKMLKNKRRRLAGIIKTLGPNYVNEFLRVSGVVMGGKAASQGQRGLFGDDKHYGLSVPEPLNSILRFFFHAVNTDHYYEK